MGGPQGFLKAPSHGSHTLLTKLKPVAPLTIQVESWARGYPRVSSGGQGGLRAPAGGQRWAPGGKGPQLEGPLLQPLPLLREVPGIYPSLGNSGARQLGVDSSSAGLPPPTRGRGRWVLLCPQL